MSALSILLIGLLLGMKHATEADHLAAVATLATRQASLAQTLRLGLAWGVGHTLMLFAGAVLALGLVVSPSLEHALETAVGLMLVGLGIDVLRRLRRKRIHFHVHAHSHCGEGAHAASVHQHGWRWPLRALAVGSILGMALLSVVIALPLWLSAVYLSSLHRGMTALVGAGSCALGVFMVVQIGYLRSLLLA